MISAALALCLTAIVSSPAANVSSCAQPGASTRLHAQPMTQLQIEQRLARGKYLTRTRVDGHFDDATTQAVMALQGEHHLQRDGVIGPNTRAALRAQDAPQTLRATDAQRWVQVNLDRQTMYLMRGNRLIHIVHISSGRSGLDTPKGSYTVQWRDRHGWSEKYDAPMPYAQYFIGGYAMHESASVPGSPASHGCVRLPAHEAPVVWDWVDVGSRLIVR